ncbi:nuclear transport factor 2 family protein [Vallicoccus soli]|uniref:Nuclear transport factor 2 family protein n=1 Tax=Vallicoccus soli TaxID=2339232 RepID=A0A3A3Z274_9ACTN|nr:nuclear transport factor 2 family protein [Vallicoccus soli]RJK97482.1 nuclear transport factor 2 family protein [Vallicoccus soli]
MADTAELLRANLLDVFGERDPERRRAAIERTYAPDVTFSDPDETVTGHDALGAKAQRILDEAPGFVFAPAGPVLVNHDLGYLAWGFGPAGQPPVVRGADVALVADGAISRIWTFLLD